ncbi:MAG: hypothetical protein GWN58_37650 [Anaerolineae bacterium]|nr:hypothetical protein [Anaerolineae bacterium]
MIAPILGVGLLFLVLGFFIVEICFPAQWKTRGVWLTTSLVGIPLGLTGAALMAAYPPLVIGLLIVAFAGGGVVKSKR